MSVLQVYNMYATRVLKLALIVSIQLDIPHDGRGLFERGHIDACFGDWSNKGTPPLPHGCHGHCWHACCQGSQRTHWRYGKLTRCRLNFFFCYNIPPPLLSPPPTSPPPFSYSPSPLSLHPDIARLPSIERKELFSAIFDITTYRPPANIQLPEGYQPPTLTISKLYWKGWLLLLVCVHIEILLLCSYIRITYRLKEYMYMYMYMYFVLEYCCEI